MSAMIRDVERLADRTYDVLIVGGGIYGLAAAYDAAQRGLSVALVERDDFGSGSSFNHHRTIHGGLRYLEHGELGVGHVVGGSAHGGGHLGKVSRTMVRQAA